MYIIYSASRDDVPGATVYQGLTTEVVPMEEWESIASFETLDAAQEALKEYKSGYLQVGPGILKEYFIAEDGVILEYAEGLFTKKSKKGFNIFAIGLCIAVIVVVRLIYTSAAARAFFTSKGIFILLILLVAGLAASYIKDGVKKKGKAKK